jgi:hypothetical protein
MKEIPAWIKSGRQPSQSWLGVITLPVYWVGCCLRLWHRAKNFLGEISFLSNHDRHKLCARILFSGSVTLVIYSRRANAFFAHGPQISDKLQRRCPSAEVIIGEGRSALSGAAPRCFQTSYLACMRLVANSDPRELMQDLIKGLRRHWLACTPSFLSNGAFLPRCALDRRTIGCKTPL